MKSHSHDKDSLDINFAVPCGNLSHEIHGRLLIVYSATHTVLSRLRPTCESSGSFTYVIWDRAILCGLTVDDQVGQIRLLVWIKLPPTVPGN